jgi:peptidoglycan/xylan/chitin deacetylase (PgdA/CDA1 family)
MVDYNNVMVSWPDDKKFGLILTHDVDRVRKTYQYMTHFFRTRRFYHIKSFFSNKNPYWTFKQIMDIENNLNVKSTFFFLNERKKINFFRLKTYELSLGRYRIKDPAVTKIIKELNNNGWEIGLHGSFDSYCDINLLRKEKNELEKIVGKPVIGIRQHYLNLSIPTTWFYQQKVGFKYDASFGMTRELGFRDQIKNIFMPDKINMYVIPTVIMDAVLFSTSRTYKDAWDKVITIIKEVKQNGGVLCIVWHTERFNNNEFPEQGQFYIDLINYCRQEGAWIGPCYEAIKYIKR